MVGQGLSCLIQTTSRTLGGQSGTAVTCPHDNHQDVGSNPATARNENQTSQNPLHRTWPKGLDRISVEDR